MYQNYGSDPYGPPMKNGYGGPTAPRSGRRSRLNVVAICLALFLPWIIFCFTMACKSFWWAYMYSGASNGVVFALFLIVLAIGVAAFMQLRAWYQFEATPWGARRGPPEPTWYFFIFVTALIGWIAGLILGNLIFSTYMQQFYDTNNLNTYTFVDPVLMRGQQMMDAGRLSFVSDVYLVSKYAMSFTNEKTYCVAPLSSNTAAAGTPLTHYDFWAVGTNCCSDTTNEFRCGEYDQHVTEGLRVMEDENRNFYRLAVQQAESAFGISAIHPIFVTFTSDATSLMLKQKAMGSRLYTLSMFVFFFVQLILVIIAARCLPAAKWIR